MSDATAARPAGLFRSVLGPYLPQALAVAVFLGLALEKGVPALRHDWWMSSRAPELIAQAAGGLATWRGQGLGAPTIYPADYLFYAVVFVLAHVVSPAGVLATILLGMALLVIAASRALPNAGSNVALQCGATCVLLFNPWTYTELVAGHLTMLLSYAATAYVIAESSKGRGASVLRICLATLLIAQQLQFLLIFLFGGVALWYALGMWQPLATAVVVGAPVWIGVAFGYRELLQIPYTLAWERDQSLHILAAFQLRGYFTRYSDALGKLGTLSSTLVAVLALASAAIVRTRTALLVALGIVVAIAIVAGANSPLGPLYEFVVTHVSATGVFRELYDLVAYIVIGYVLLAAMAAHRAAWIGPLLALAGAGLFASWIFGAPARYWVAASALPAISLDAAANSRFAMMPAFQPLRFRGQGSGADPNAFDRPNNVTPLNAYVPSYPTVTAFARYIATNDTSLMRGLSVSEIVERPWLCTDAVSLSAQTSSHPPQHGACGQQRPAVRLAFTPELTQQPHYAIGTLDTLVGSGNVLLQDAVRAGLVPGIAPHTLAPRSFGSGVDASADWVDARLFFALNPELGQSYGGVYTHSSAPFPVRPGEEALVLVKGALLGLPGDRFLTRTANGYHWIEIPQQTLAVRCIGSCAIAAQATSTFGYPLNPPANASSPIEMHVLLPWLWQAQLPALAKGSLVRLNITYTEYWKMLGMPAMQHVRVDGSVNGWVARDDTATRTVYLIEARSCALQLTELLVVLVLAAWGIVAFVVRRRGMHTQA
jgi:hypothetical protein